MPATAIKNGGDSPIVWDVITQHLDEAEFALEQLELALDSAVYRIDEVRDGPEERLFNNLDALLIGGPPVVRGLLAPRWAALLAAPRPPEPSRVGATALALLLAGENNLVTGALEHDAIEVRRGVVRACGLLPVADKLPPATSGPVAAQIAAARGWTPTGGPAFSQSRDSDELLAGLIVARAADPEAHLAAVEPLLSHDERRVRDAAMVTALHGGSLAAWELCQRLAAERSAPHPLAMALVASFGGPSWHQRLVAQLAPEKTRQAALRALGFCGSSAVVPELLAYLESPNEVDQKLALEAIVTIIGGDEESLELNEPRPEWDSAELPPPELDDEARRSLPPLEEDDLDADLMPAAEEELPVPDKAAIVRFWRRVQGDFAPTASYLAGRPAGSNAFVAPALEALETLPTRRRHLIALALSIRTAGTGRVDTWASARAQIARVRALRADPPPIVRHPYDA